MPSRTAQKRDKHTNGKPAQPVVEVPIPEAPDFLGVGGRVAAVSEILYSAQSQRASLETQRLINQHKLTDPMPGTNPEITYARRFKDLDEGIQRIMKENVDIIDELRAAALKRRRELEQQTS